MPTCYDRAREAARTGYSIAENIYCHGLFEVRSPDGLKYLVDLKGEEPICTCQASCKCKHVGLVEIAQRYAATLDRRALEIARTARRERLGAMIAQDFA